MKKLLIFSLLSFIFFTGYAQLKPNALQVYQGAKKSSFIFGTKQLDIFGDATHCWFDFTGNRPFYFLDSIFQNGYHVLTTQDTTAKYYSKPATDTRLNLKMNSSDTSVVRTTGDQLYGNYTFNNNILTHWTNSTSLPRGLILRQYGNDANGYKSYFGKARGTFASPTAIATGDTIGHLMFRGYDGTDFRHSASITAISSGTIGAYRVPSSLVFSTTTDSAPGVPTERWRITSAGVLQSNGAQTIKTSSGDLTLAANSDNTIIAGNLSSSLTIYTPSLTQAEVLYFKSGVTLQGSIYMQGTSSGATTTRNKLNYNCAINDVGGHIFSQVISNVTCYPFIIGSNGNLLINNTSTVADSGSYSLSFNGTAARTIGMESATGTNIVGNNLTINASASTGTGKGGDLVFQTSKGSATTGTTSNTVADSFRVLSRTAIVDVALTTVVTNASKGMLMLASGDGESYAWINFTSAGVVTLIQGSGDISVTDTGTGTSKICIYPNGTQVQVINRYAANKNITVTVIYNQ